MPDRMIKSTLAVAVAAFFAVMWGLLLRQHLFVGGAPTFQPSYEALLKPDQKERIEQWGVYFAGRRIGQSELRITRDMEGLLHIQSQTSIAIEPALRYLLGTPGNLDVTFKAAISPLTGLHDFQVNSTSINTRLLGVVDEDTIKVRGYVAGETVRTDLPYTPGVFLGEVFSPFTSLPELSKSDVGRTWSVDMVNPLAAGMQRVTVEMAARREVELDGERTPVYRLDFTTSSTRWESWVTEDGSVLVQGTPFGLTIRREDLPAEVLQQLQAETPAAPPPSAPGR